MPHASGFPALSSALTPPTTPTKLPSMARDKLNDPAGAVTDTLASIDAATLARWAGAGGPGGQQACDDPAAPVGAGAGSGPGGVAAHQGERAAAVAGHPPACADGAAAEPETAHPPACADGAAAETAKIVDKSCPSGGGMDKSCPKNGGNGQKLSTYDRNIGGVDGAAVVIDACAAQPTQSGETELAELAAKTTFRRRLARLLRPRAIRSARSLPDPRNWGELATLTGILAGLEPREPRYQSSQGPAVLVNLGIGGGLVREPERAAVEV